MAVSQDEHIKAITMNANRFCYPEKIKKIQLFTKRPYYFVLKLLCTVHKFKT
jgi:hypothetical protein